MSNHSQQFPQHVNSSSSISTMIPTPGLPQSGNSSLMVTSSVGNSMIAASGCIRIASSAVNTGSFLPTASAISGGMHSGSFNSSDGPLTNGYQQSLSNFSFSSGGNSMVSSIGGQRIASQMIPTPGFNNTENTNNNNNNQSYMNLESNNAVGFSSVESTMVSQPLQQKKHIGGQNSHILHSLGSHMGGGIRSGLQQKSYGFSNGAISGGLGMMGNNLQIVNGPGTAEGYQLAPLYGNSPKPLQHLDQHQRQMLQSDAYGSSIADSSSSGNFYIPVTSAGSLTINQNLNPESLQSAPKTNSPLMTNQSNLLTTQQAVNIKPSIDQSEKMNFESPHSLRDNLVQSHQQQQFQQQPQHFQQQQFVEDQCQQKQQSQQHQALLKHEAFGQSQMTSDIGILR